jgi:hypothetical protein
MARLWPEGKILVHRDIETTMIYTHQTDEHIKGKSGTLILDS